MAYSIRPATIADIPHIVAHRVGMFREMGIAAEFEDMAAASELWLRDAIPSKTYLGWMAESKTGDVVAGGGLLIAVVVLPLFAPPAIFGAGALTAATMGLPYLGGLALLAAWSLFSVVISPIVAALCVRDALG